MTTPERAGADFRTMFSLAGRMALVTGASRGIGAAIARMLGQMGADVAVNHLDDAAAAAAVVGELHAIGRRAAALDVDVGRKDVATALVMATEAALGPIDVLVICAARSIYAKLEDVREEDVDAQIETNFKAMVRLLNGVVPGMAKRRFGRVVTIGSIVQAAPLPILPIYAAMKAAHDNLMRGLACRWAAHGVTLQQRVARADPHRAQCLAPRARRRLGRIFALGELRGPRGRTRGSRVHGGDVLRAWRVIRHGREPVCGRRRADPGPPGHGGTNIGRLNGGSYGLAKSLEDSSWYSVSAPLRGARYRRSRW